MPDTGEKTMCTPAGTAAGLAWLRSINGFGATGVHGGDSPGSLVVYFELPAEITTVPAAVHCFKVCPCGT